ncbi:MAG TPA: hypothetical protein VFU73_00235 [Actinocrinis sp.]|nr:hypothetical protein [Actinocrinis sp.]
MAVRTATMARQHGFQAAWSAVTLAAFGVICASSAQPVRQIAGLSLIGAFAGAIWSIRRERFDAGVPALGLTLALLILAGLALAAVHALSTVPVALAVGVATLAVTWVGVSFLTPEPAERRAWIKTLNPLAITGVLIFAAAAVLAVHFSATSATADADAASSVAIWAYPAHDQLHVGVKQPSGHGATSLRIVVTQAGATVASWNDIRLAAGQTWEAPALTVTGNAPAQVVALHGGTVVASLSSR